MDNIYVYILYSRRDAAKCVGGPRGYLHQPVCPGAAGTESVSSNRKYRPFIDATMTVITIKLLQ